MKLMPMGDYYLWHCEWCDSTNQTLWTRLAQEGLACAACQQRLPELVAGPALQGRSRSRGIAAPSLTL